ncbi:AAA family ATPase [Coleofasciculus sp. FACHB-SPT9]|uniref:AAA family ATPase n=1 Tax=Cyanophyceae TaxID=3028117 RepID=UPI0016862228|nr:AAA family ATPase [Coleofasciculus sp. FACHB-SPT9]MBD1893016.1 AAA family ATPase [Coleofasciculus sp. FACHB-SPT9]
MTVISFVNEKGGSTKSTSALHFAYWLATKKKKKIQVVDGDPQRSLSRWFASMESPIPVTALISPDELLEQIPVLANSVDFLVVDGAGSLAESTRAILFRTDLAVIPCQPSKLDLDAAADTVRLIKQAQSVRGGLPKAAVFLSRAQKNTRLKTEAISLLEKIPDLISLKTIIHQRQSTADAFGQSATVWDLPGSGAIAATGEFEQLFKEILRLVP